MVCDAVAAGTLGTGRYSRALVEVAGLMLQRPAPRLGVAMARATKLERRLSRIGASPPLGACLARWPVRFSVGSAFLLVTGALALVEPVERSAAAPDTSPEPASSGEVGGVFEIEGESGIARGAVDLVGRVLDARGRPISGARVTRTLEGGAFTERSPSATTDAEGRFCDLQGVPAVFLIGPEGRILARDLRASDMLDAVRAALAR